VKARLRSFAFSFQTRLVLALCAVIVLAIFLAGTVFVVRNRDDRKEQALDRVAAASPAIYQQAFLALLPGQTGSEFSATLQALAREQDLRILILSRDGVILYDTEDRLDGQGLTVPRSTFSDIQRGFVAWEPASGFPEEDLTLVSASSRIVTNTGREFPFRIVLAVKTDTIASAWLGILPGLALAALVSIPLASAAGVLLARQVSKPVRKLTAASEALARGDFNQHVETDIDDEIGRLARAFTVMAGRVGERDAQMRALLANVSHDLKTPMTSITGYAQSLSDGTAGPDDAARIGGVIREEAQHVNSLLSDLLYLAEIDAGHVVTRREDVPLEALAARCVRRVEPAAQARDVDVSVDVPADLVLHDVDPEKLERAFTNVLDNAAKFTPQGGQIAVRAWCENGSGPPVVRCAVTNSGSVIAGDDLPRVFDRFFRGDRARRTASGSGLGLSITRELVELNGGTIEAASDERGVTFTISLPA
jgi:signal transduction histidine kinase